MHILAIESSCDETAVAVVENGITVLSNTIASSRDFFKASGGVIPEEAARKQIECMLPVLHQALKEAHCTPKEIDAIAVTRGPGLLGSLLVGTVTARGLAALWNKPLIGVHHTLGHLSSTWLDCSADDLPQFPILTLSASGGHTDLWYRSSHTQGRLLGSTRDDAAGEAFDKGASLLHLPYPGGPSIAKAAEQGNPDAFPFPLPLKKEPSFDFSFSGLKTALRYTIRDAKLLLRETPSQGVSTDVADLAASYQEAICNHLLDRIALALHKHPDIQEVHIVGGVSANIRLRTLLTQLDTGTTVRWPKSLRACTDNAAMIAAAAEFLVREKGNAAYRFFETAASLPLSAAIQ